MKAILLIDIDDDSFDKYENFYADYDLLGENDYEIKTIKQGKDWLLKPIPKSINEEEAFDITKVNNHTYLNGVVDGYSICLDEIFGEQKWKIE